MLRASAWNFGPENPPILLRSLKMTLVTFSFFSYSKYYKTRHDQGELPDEGPAEVPAHGCHPGHHGQDGEVAQEAGNCINRKHMIWQDLAFLHVLTRQLPHPDGGRSAAPMTLVFLPRAFLYVRYRFLL
jgi:hypothetical protein